MPDRIWVRFQKHLGQVAFDFVLMGDEQVALGAVNAGVVQADGLNWVNVNDKQNFLIFRFSLTFWAKSETFIGVGIEEEIIKRGKFPEVGRFFGHDSFYKSNIARQLFTFRKTSRVFALT